MSPIEPKLVVTRRLQVRLRDLLDDLLELQPKATDARLVLVQYSELEAEIRSLRAQLVELVGEPADKQEDRPTPKEGMPRSPTPPPGSFSGVRPRSDTSPGMAAWTEPPKSEEK